MMITVQAESGTFTCYEDDWVIREIQSCGGFSRPEVAMISRFLREGDTALDVGAHIGTFSVPLKRTIGKSGRLFSFEANPETFYLLEKNLRDNDIEATILNKGVSVQEGSLFLKGHRLNDRSHGNEGPLNSGADHLTSVRPEQGTAIQVDLVKIDDVVPGVINFIKIDVEGMEMSVLLSAQKKIDQYRPIVYSEYFDYYLKRAGAVPQHYEDFFKNRSYHFFINAKGRKASNDEFVLVRIPGPKYIRGQVDFLLIPNDSDRYPTTFLDWKVYRPHLFIFNRVLNELSQLKAALRRVIKGGVSVNNKKGGPI